MPPPLCDLPEPALSSEGVRLLSSCFRKVGELEGHAQVRPELQHVPGHVRPERGPASAQIEGTQCTFDDILDPANSEPVKKDGFDVVSYVRATDFAVDRMRSLPLCIRLLKEAHGVLFDGTRGQKKNPGQTQSPPKIGLNCGCALEDASYAPPNIEDMADALSDLERFIHSLQLYSTRR